MLNFENKLEGLQDRPDYPKEKPWYFRPDKDSLVDYNIITNYSLKDHYFDAPEKRPECAEWKVSYTYILKTLIFFLQVKFPPNMNKNFKDYNIVSNKYLEFND